MGRIFFQCLDFYRNFAICNLQFAFYNSGLSGLGIGMKIKRIQIGIKSLDDTLREAGEVFEKVAAGKSVRRRSAIYFRTITEMRRFLTEKRLELIKVIKDR